LREFLKPAAQTAFEHTTSAQTGYLRQPIEVELALEIRGNEFADALKPLGRERRFPRVDRQLYVNQSIVAKQKSISPAAIRCLVNTVAPRGRGALARV
jgi:hypothetical protein